MAKSMSGITTVLPSRRQLVMVREIAQYVDAQPIVIMSNAIKMYKYLWESERDGYHLVVRIDCKLRNYFISRPEGLMHRFKSRLHSLFAVGRPFYAVKNTDVQTILGALLSSFDCTLEELFYHALVTYRDTVALERDSGGESYLRKPPISSDCLPVSPADFRNKSDYLYLISNPLQSIALFKD